jgi:hypothetical protein
LRLPPEFEFLVRLRCAAAVTDVGNQVLLAFTQATVDNWGNIFIQIEFIHFRLVAHVFFLSIGDLLATSSRIETTASIMQSFRL